MYQQGIILDDFSFADSFLFTGIAKKLSIGQRQASIKPIQLTPILLESSLIDKTSANITVKVDQKAENIERVWVDVIPPIIKTTTEAITDLVQFPLQYNAATQSYQGTLTNLNQNGNYQIITRAQSGGVTSFPLVQSLLSFQSARHFPYIEVINNEIQVVLPHINFDQQGYEARLRLISSPNPEQYWLELIPNSLQVTKVGDISATAEKISLKISIPALKIGNETFGVKLFPVSEQASLIWSVHLREFYKNDFLN